MKVYLAVPIVANRDLERARAMARAIVDSRHEVSSPWVPGHSENHSPSTLGIFETDREGAEGSDMIVADVSKPSTGVGMEVMAAHYLGKRIIVVMGTGSVVSKTLTHGPKETIEFDENSDLYQSLKRVLDI